ncbi:hypothetical protein NEHOM01_0672 [Nematocida homosporus]|uniref:uncharacterized protein n=1 Tax=Nematocida homosporus TaxID=1912981 RepID=UPI00221EF3F2|nr:uncharacterized protein NEHOM01_0672 [Nematocida homosporus]KAI5185214.1 hypothetical protein NEHOM01_0672 [Nematocida homosporus]
MPVELHAIAYANGCADEIQRIEREIREKPRNKMLFQTLPFHKRRRTASFDERRIPKEARRGEKSRRRAIRQRVVWGSGKLHAHTWYAKRFFMHTNLGTTLPYKRHMKSDKFIAAALSTRGLLSDISYCKVYLAGGVGLDVLSPQVEYSSNYSRSIVWQNSTECIIIKDTQAEVNQGGSGESVNENENKCEVIGGNEEMPALEDLCIFMFYGEQKMYAATGYVNCRSARELVENRTGPLAYVCMALDQTRVVLLINRARCMEVMQKCVVGGIVPISTLELFRIGTELDRVVYPFDLLSTRRGHSLWEATNQAELDVLAKKPRGKRPVDVLPLFTGDLTQATPYLFVADKGSFMPGSPVILAESLNSSEPEGFPMSGQESVVGCVLRSSFSFKRGRTTGVLYLAQLPDSTQTPFIRNRRSHQFYPVSLTPITPCNTI